MNPYPYLFGTISLGRAHKFMVYIYSPIQSPHLGIILRVPFHSSLQYGKLTVLITPPAKMGTWNTSSSVHSTPSNAKREMITHADMQTHTMPV